jgi:hypothetical protein
VYKPLTTMPLSAPPLGAFLTPFLRGALIYPGWIGGLLRAISHPLQVFVIVSRFTKDILILECECEVCNPRLLVHPAPYVNDSLHLDTNEASPFLIDRSGHQALSTWSENVRIHPLSIFNPNVRCT